MLKKPMKLSDQQMLIIKPSDMKKYLSTDQSKLYELIWNRALSSQMNQLNLIEKV